MKEFDELGYQGQIRRLRHISVNVLQEYAIDDPTLKLLAHHRQTTFKVQSQRTGEKFLLRFHRSAYRHPATVRSELCWLRSLRKNTNVVVPEPVPTLDGEDVPKVTGEGLPGDLSCSLMKWIEGKRYFRKNGPGVRVLSQVGRIMADMHRHAENFSPPEDFRCPTWNWERLFHQTSEEMTDAERHFLDAEERKLFQETERRVKAAMEALGTKSGEFGIIHGDLIQSNYLIHGGEVRVIDFADFGYGHFLYDMGITLFGLWGLDKENRQRNAYLSGYRDVRPLSFDHESLLELFIAARAVVQARFVMTSEHSADQRIAARFVQKVLSGLRLGLSTSSRMKRCRGIRCKQLGGEMIICETERLYLREWVPDDWKRFKPLATDPRVLKFIGAGTPLTDDQIKGRIDKWVRQARERGWILWAVIHREDSELIGFCGFWDGFAPDVEIGWRLRPEYWGQGLATEAAKAVMEYGFRRWGFPHLISVAQPENKASLRIMEKLGMEFERSFLHDGFEVVCYSKVNPAIEDARMRLHVRPYREEDEAAVVELWGTVFPNPPSWNVPVQDIRRKLSVQPELFLVAVFDGRVVGTTMAGFDGHRGWLHLVAIHPDNQRQGIGRAMMEEAERRLRELGCMKVNLQVRSTNTGVLAFYESLGYMVEDRISMGKRLTQTAHLTAEERQHRTNQESQ